MHFAIKQPTLFEINFVKIYPVNDIFHHSTPKEETFYFLQGFLLATMPTFSSAPMTIFKDLPRPFFVQDHKPLVRFAFANIVKIAI